MDDPKNHLATLTGNWKITINSYMPSGNSMTPSHEGVTLSANTAGCLNDEQTQTIGVMLSVIPPHGPHTGNVDFYLKDGPQSPSWGHNRRFRDTATYGDYDCSTDRDMCERIAAVSVNGSQATSCTEADCLVMITELK